MLVARIVRLLPVNEQLPPESTDLVDAKRRADRLERLAQRYAKTHYGRPR